MQSSNVISGDLLQSGENALESSLVSVEKLTGSTSNLNELILLVKSNLFCYLKI